MLILGIDPGTTQSGWAIINTHEGPVQVADSGVMLNAEMLAFVKSQAMIHGPTRMRIAIEWITSYGMAVGQEVFETCLWAGRFMQAWSKPEDVVLIPRREVKGYLCAGNPKAKDANVRQAIMEMFPATGGDAKGNLKNSIGTIKHPGPLYGVTSHAWPALGVALTYLEKQRPKARPRMPTGLDLDKEVRADDARRKSEGEFEPQPMPMKGAVELKESQTPLDELKHMAATSTDMPIFRPYVESDFGDSTQGF